MIHVFLLLFLLTSLLGNCILLYFFPFIGLVVNFVTIVIFLLIAVFDISDTNAREIFALSASFLLVNFMTLYFHFSGIYLNSLIIYLLLFVLSIIYCVKVFPDKKLFHAQHILYIFAMIPVGILFGFVTYYILSFSQFLIQPLQPLQVGTFILIMVVAEEIFFRALIQNAVVKMTDTFIAITFTSLLYGLFHFSSNIFVTLLFILLSLVYGATYAMWKNIYIAIGVNLLVNVTFYALSSNLLVFAVR